MNYAICLNTDNNKESLQNKLLLNSLPLNQLKNY